MTDTPKELSEAVRSGDDVERITEAFTARMKQGWDAGRGIVPVCRDFAQAIVAERDAKSEPTETPRDFRADLSALINSHSLENTSDTPDFILAAFLCQCLAAWEYGIESREYGKRRQPETLTMGEPEATPPLTMGMGIEGGGVGKVYSNKPEMPQDQLDELAERLLHVESLAERKTNPWGHDSGEGMQKHYDAAIDELTDRVAAITKLEEAKEATRQHKADRASLVLRKRDSEVTKRLDDLKLKVDQLDTRFGVLIFENIGNPRLTGRIDERLDAIDVIQNAAQCSAKLQDRDAQKLETRVSAIESLHNDVGVIYNGQKAQRDVIDALTKRVKQLEDGQMQRVEGTT